MKTIFNVLAIVFLALGLAFTILPLGTIAFLPVGIALFFAAVALFIAKEGGKKLSFALLVVSFALGLAVVVKNVFIADTVAIETEEELLKRDQSEQENMMELEELDSLLNELELLDELE